MKDVTITQLKNRIKGYEKFAQQYKEIWKRNIEILDGKHYPDNYTDEDKIVINHIWSIVNTLIADIYIANPYITINPTKDVTEAKTDIYENLINYIYRKIRFKYEMRKVIKDVFYTNFGVLKFGYIPKGIFDYNEYVCEDSVFSLRINPKNLIIDPEADDFETAKWVGHKYILPYDDVMEDEFFENTKELKASVSQMYFSTDELQDEDIEKINTDVKRVTLNEIWDKRTQRYYIIVDGYNKYLKNEKFPYKIKGLPFKFLEFDTHPTKLFGVPFITQIFPMNEELNKTRTQQMRHRARALAKILFEEGMIDVGSFVLFSICEIFICC